MANCNCGRVVAVHEAYLLGHLTVWSTIATQYNDNLDLGEGAGSKNCTKNTSLCRGCSRNHFSMPKDRSKNGKILSRILNRKYRGSITVFGQTAFYIGATYSTTTVKRSQVGVSPTQKP